MFKNKGVKPTNKQVVIKPKVLILKFIWWMATTKSKVIEEHVFKDRKLVKKKFVVD
jgi:hypothetical protein